MRPLSRSARAIRATSASLPTALLLGLLTTPCTSQWTQQTPANAPTARTGHAMDYSSFFGHALLFGGFDGALRNDTWQWDGIDWMQRSSSQQPPPRRSHALADASGAFPFVVMFGGDSGTGLLGDTWTWAGTWLRIGGSPGPAPRRGHAMAYDSTRNRVVLFGGDNGTGLFSDTWEWDGRSWQQITTTTSPPSRSGHAMTFDPVRGEIVLFGGNSALPLNDTWTYDGADWRFRSPIRAPGNRAGASLAFDRERARAVLFGGSTAGVALNETWEWDGRNWYLRTPATGAPSPRSGAAMTYDLNRGEIVLFGGQAAALDGATWTWRPVVHASFTRFGRPCPPGSGPTLRPLAGSEPRTGDVFTLELTGSTSPTLPFGVVGFSRTQTGGVPLPRPLPGGCVQRVEDFYIQLLPNANPATWQLFIPGAPALIGTSFHVQGFLTDLAVTAITGVSNAGEAYIGGPIVEAFIDEDFVSEARMDTRASSGTWINGQTFPGILGGDGRHGSFDPTLGMQVTPGTYEWDTDSFTIPGSHTLSGQAETITDGRFYFSDLTVPAGVTVRFVGSSPPILRVRGAAEIHGTLQANGEAMTTFQARDRFNAALLPGQPGGLGGPGGGRGGKGADRCGGNGPTIIAGINTNDGQPGEDVRLTAGHAYAAQAIGTGGLGSPLFPATGLNSSVTYRVSFGAFSGMIGAGGGGGGFDQAGGIGMALTTPSPPPNAGQIGPPSAGGIAFSAFPVPAGPSSLDHFAIGGSGGGGGGSHTFLAVVSAFPDTWRAGAGGSGGGGVIAIRAGRHLSIAGTARLEARGGGGFSFTDLGPGIPCPGGGGSGGSVLLQSGGAIVLAGDIDTSGGPGSTVGPLVPVTLSGTSAGGAGAAGAYRLESGTGTPQITSGSLTPPLNPASAIGPLTDRDAQTGSRSVWLGTGQTEVPTWLRYEAEVSINGQTTVFSDDPAFGSPANAPGSPVQIWFQGAPADPYGAVIEAAAGPWRSGVGPASRISSTISRDASQFVRFDLAYDTSMATSVAVLRLRLFYR